MKRYRRAIDPPPTAASAAICDVLDSTSRFLVVLALPGPTPLSLATFTAGGLVGAGQGRFGALGGVRVGGPGRL